MEKPKYSIVIQWSEEDACYVVFSPEWERYVGPIADGKTYEEAARRGENALENMIDFAQERGDTPPQAHTFSSETAEQ